MKIAIAGACSRGDSMIQRRSRRSLLVAFLVTAALIARAEHPAAALCMPPMEVAGAVAEVAVNHRYAWFLIESFRYARTAWQEADNASDSQHPVVTLADLKLAVEDFQCAASLLQMFQRLQGPDEYTMKAMQVSAAGATEAYRAFAAGFQRSATALARGEVLPLEVAADVRVQNQKAGELLITAAGSAWFALLRPPPDPKATMDRLTLTRVQRAALLEGLKRRGFRAAPKTDSPDTHSPDLAAAVLYQGLSSPRYKAVDDP